MVECSVKINDNIRQRWEKSFANGMGRRPEIAEIRPGKERPRNQVRTRKGGVRTVFGHNMGMEFGLNEQKLLGNGKKPGESCAASLQAIFSNQRPRLVDSERLRKFSQILNPGSLVAAGLVAPRLEPPSSCEKPCTGYH